MSEESDRAFDELTGPSAGERARAHAASGDGGGREVQAYEAGKEQGRKEADKAYSKGVTVGKDAERARRSGAGRAPTPRAPSAPASIRSSGSESPWKLLILAECLGLLAVSFNATRDPAQPWIHELLTKAGLKRTIATVVLLVMLMLLADLGLGGPAALFGATVLLAYLAGHGVGAGNALLNLERKVFA